MMTPVSGNAAAVVWPTAADPAVSVLANRIATRSGATRFIFIRRV